MAKKLQDQELAISSEDQDFAQLLDEHLRAGYQCLYVHTSEEARAETEIGIAARNLNMGIVTWDCFEGFSADGMTDAKYRSAVTALEALADESLFSGNQVFIFRDLDDFTVDTQVRRRLRSLTEGNRLVNKKHKRPMIILSPKLFIHEKLKSHISVVDFALPGEAKLERVIEFVRRSIESKDAAKAVCNDELRDQLVTALLGLTANESENCLARCLVRHGGFTLDMLRTIRDEKAAIVKQSEVLTYIQTDITAAEIGGFDLYMSWLARRKMSYTPEARKLNIDYPKGVVLVGPPGTGKSMVGKATCLLLGLPGYILDIGSLFGSLVGESEQRTRDVLKQIDAQQGCVLLIDEADKALGHAHNSQGDSGVTRRVFGTILTWLAEKRAKTFCIMTLNRTEGLPPELTRAGRFDAIFYTDLPQEAERQQILEIHIRKRGVDPGALNFSIDDWTAIVDKTKGFVGSELEEVVREGRYLSFERRQSGKPTFEEIIEAAAGIVPMSQRDKEGIEEIRAFCKNKAKPVTSVRTSKRRSRQRSVNVDN